VSANPLGSDKRHRDSVLPARAEARIASAFRSSTATSMLSTWRAAGLLDAGPAASVLERLARAGTMLGGTEALARFLDWQSPDEEETPHRS
jgi:hypothetical protein